MGFRALRVINESRLPGGEGFPTLHHANMEILTLVVEGTLEHSDSTGTRSTLAAGEGVLVSAGSGVAATQRNASSVDRLVLYHAWIYPDRQGLTPASQPIRCQNDHSNAFTCFASSDSSRGAATICQGVGIYRVRPSDGRPLIRPIDPGRQGWLQVLGGTVRVSDQPLGEGDGVAIDDLPSLKLSDGNDADLLWIDLP